MLQQKFIQFYKREASNVSFPCLSFSRFLHHSFNIYSICNSISYYCSAVPLLHRHYRSQPLTAVIGSQSRTSNSISQSNNVPTERSVFVHAANDKIVIVRLYRRLLVQFSENNTTSNFRSCKSNANIGSRADFDQMRTRDAAFTSASHISPYPTNSPR